MGEHSYILTGLIGGIASALTPIGFSILIAFSILFEQLGDSPKQYRTNILAFCFSIILFYLVFAPQIIINIKDNQPYISQLFSLLLVISIFFFLAMLIKIFLRDKYFDKKWVQLPFRIFGIILLSIYLGFLLFSSMGPLLGAMLVDIAVEGESWHIYISLLGYGMGIVLSFGLLLRLVSMFYPRLKGKMWLKILQIVVIFLFLFNAIASIFS